MIRLMDLKKASTVSVHFVRPEEIKNDLNSLDLTVLEGTIADVKTDKELFAVVASAMQFPDYFGHNWDALDECLCDMDWLPAEGYLLVLRDSAKGWSQNPYVLGRFVTTWLEASEYWMEEDTPFHLVFVM
jgi:RNAse (barnase) inhibitor barstar